MIGKGLDRWKAFPEDDECPECGAEDDKHETWCSSYGLKRGSRGL